MVKTNWKTKAWLFLLFAVGYVFFYVLPNFRPMFPPVELPQLFIDRVVPFLPWTFFIYLSDYLFIFVAIYLTQGEAFFSFARQMFGGLVMCGAFFMFFPTTYPRPPYPQVDNVFLQMAMNMVAAGDMPTNCFPSMHVALTGICAWNLRDRNRHFGALYWTWALLIFASTLTTKQHYFVDILGGTGVMVAMHWLEQSYARSGVSVRGWFSKQFR